LTRLAQEGIEAEIVFVIQRNDCHSFAPAKEIDPEYARLLAEAIKAGVKVRPLVAELSLTGVRLTEKALPLAPF
ncbi:MAG: DNA/RNA nuclease SfsA, partial [Bdellovibrionia bacterium]